MMIGFLFLVGCDLANTPTAQVEEYLSKYQRLDNEISLDESFLIEEKDLNSNIIKVMVNVLVYNDELYNEFKNTRNITS